jgi:arylformamidase
MKKVYDLTAPTTKHWRWYARPMQWHSLEEGDTFNHTFMTINMHGFTHADAPWHYLADGADISEVPLDKYWGTALVVDLSEVVGPNDGVTAELLEQHADDVQEGDIVLLRTDWPLKADMSSLRFWGEAPYTDRSACEWLIDRKVKLVGYDYPPDYVLRYQVTDPQKATEVPREDNTTHDAFFPEGIAVIEYLINLHTIPTRRTNFLALPIPFEGSDGSPVRAIAFE